MEPVLELETIDQIENFARQKMSEASWQYASVGGGQEVTLRRNRADWQKMSFLPSVLRDVSEIDISTKFVGIDLAMPVMCAPVGGLERYHPEGAVAAAKGATREGTVIVAGLLTSPAFPVVQEQSSGRNLIQIYVSGDREWLDALVDQVTVAGATGICITVDSPVMSRRDRLSGTGYDWRTEREGIPPNLEKLGRDPQYRKSFTWKELERLRTRTQLPLVLKGILRADDARRAADSGIDAVYVSNHGGRALDHSVSTMAVLPEIVAVVKSHAQVIVDGGIRYGSDVCKALALGASAVLIGRSQCWGLAAGGADGVAQMLKVLRLEIENTMALLGARSLAELTPECVRSTGA